MGQLSMRVVVISSCEKNLLYNAFKIGFLEVCLRMGAFTPNLVQNNNISANIGMVVYDI